MAWAERKVPSAAPWSPLVCNTLSCKRWSHAGSALGRGGGPIELTLGHFLRMEFGEVSAHVTQNSISPFLIFILFQILTS